MEELSPSPHYPNWIAWLGHLSGKPCVGLEVGTFRGQSAEWFLANICNHEASFFLCIDHFQGSGKYHPPGTDVTNLLGETMARLERFGPKAIIQQGYSNEVLRALRNIEVDFAYIDAGHEAINVLRDAVLAFEVLKVGGVMIFDDYEWGAPFRELERPKMGIDAFLACYADLICLIHKGGQVAVRKTGSQIQP